MVWLKERKKTNDRYEARERDKQNRWRDIETERVSASVYVVPESLILETMDYNIFNTLQVISCPISNISNLSIFI